MTQPMQAIAISHPGGPEVLVRAQRPRPQSGAGEVLIRVAASGVNRPDVLQRKGAYPPPAGASDLPGLEVAGWVEGGDAAELAAAGLALGQPVCALLAGGGYAEYAAAPVGQCLPLPAGWSVVDAAGLPETAFTVWHNVFERGALQAGETLLVHGGTSGIGVMATQAAKALGARVLVTAGSAAKCEAARALGADVAINYREDDFAAAALAATGGRGADVILDMVAGDYIARDVACLADDGRLVIIAVQGGTRASFDAGQVLRRRLTITGSTLRARPAAFKARLAQAVRERLWPLATSGAIRPVTARVFDAADAAAAHALMESNAHVGKIILRWPAADAAGA